MSDEYTPTTKQVLAYIRGFAVMNGASADEAQGAATNWLVAHDAVVAAKALEDAASAFDGGTISLDVFSNEVEKSYWRVANEQRSILVDSLRARAAEYRKAVEK